MKKRAENGSLGEYKSNLIIKIGYTVSCYFVGHLGVICFYLDSIVVEDFYVNVGVLESCKFALVKGICEFVVRIIKLTDAIFG